MALSDKEITSFWAGYIIQLRNINHILKRGAKETNEQIMNELLDELCDLYKVDKTLLDDLDYEYSKRIPLKLIMKKMGKD
jgi:hypothetical protein